LERYLSKSILLQREQRKILPRRHQKGMRLFLPVDLYLYFLLRPNRSELQASRGLHGGVIDKVVEEIREIKDSKQREEKEKEFGDLLFTLVNVARWEGIDAEAALRGANNKFYKRFTKMEELCHQRGVNLADLSFDEKDKLWEEAKKQI